MLEENGPEDSTNRETPSGLPVELRADLADARIASVRHNSEAASVVDVAAGIDELSVVEDVKKFDAQIKCDLLFDGRSFQKAEVGVIESRAMEEASVRGSKCS